LKEDAKQYAIKHIVEGVVKKYSNFVGFPIMLNDSKLNTVKGLFSVPAY
jgi:HSP90 family molecular chaperone